MATARLVRAADGRGPSCAAAAGIRLLIAGFVFTASYARLEAHNFPNSALGHEAKINILKQEIRIQYAIYLTEMEALNELGNIDADGNGEFSDEEKETYFREMGEFLKNGIRFRVDGLPLQLTTQGDVALSMPFKKTYTYVCDVSALPGDTHTVYLHDQNYPESPVQTHFFVEAKAPVRVLHSSLEDIAFAQIPFSEGPMENPNRELTLSYTTGGDAAEIGADAADTSCALFIDIGDVEVKYMIRMSVALLRDWGMRLNAEQATLSPDDQSSLREQIQQAFRDGPSVTIDGISVKPILKSAEFSTPGMEARNENAKEPIPVAGTNVVITLSYGVKGRPRHIVFVWDMLTEKLHEIPAYINARSEPMKVIFTPRTTSFTWRAPGVTKAPAILTVRTKHGGQTMRIPVLSVLLVLLSPAIWFACKKRHTGAGMQWGLSLASLLGAIALSGVARTALPQPGHDAVVLPDQEQARAIFTSLHRNIYRAFDYETESDIYDALAMSVSGDLLDDIYNEVYHSFIMQDQGGAVCRIQSVNIQELHVEYPDNAARDGPAFVAHCTWTVEGVLEHWRHVHTRTNRYKADYRLQPQEGAWKIVHTHVLEQERIPATPARKETAS